MKLLYISGLYWPASGGAELSARTLIQLLSREGFEITVVTSAHTTPMNSECPEQGTRVIRLDNSSGLETAVAHLLTRNRFDAVLTQNSWADKAILLGRRHATPVICFVRGCFGELDLSVGGPYECAFVVANSDAVRDFITHRWGRHDTIVVPPLVDPSLYVVVANTHEFITLVNPVAYKGGALFKQVAALMPARSFLAVRGWDHLRMNGQWDERKLTELSEGLGVAPFIPEEEQFDGLSNVVVHPTVTDMRLVYGRTHILLVPSLVREGGPRVALEAMTNGIPVIGSVHAAAGGLLSPAGVIVTDYGNPNAWVRAITALNEPGVYTTLSELSRRVAIDRPSLSTQIQPLRDIFRRISKDKALNQ